MEAFEIQVVGKVYRRLGTKLAEKLVHLPIKPIHITWFYMFLALLGAVFILKGTYLWIALGGSLYQISLFLDFVDGSLARARGIYSELGAWLDNNGGLMIDFLVLLAAIFEEYLRYNLVWILYLGIFAVGTKFLIRTLYLQSSDIKKFDDERDHTNKINRLKSLAKNPILAELAYTRFSPAGTLFTIFALLDKLWLYIILMGLYGTFYYFAAFGLLYYKQIE